jgi:hypothetical protein
MDADVTWTVECFDLEVDLSGCIFNKERIYKNIVENAFCT